MVTTWLRIKCVLGFTLIGFVIFHLQKEFGICPLEQYTSKLAANLIEDVASISFIRIGTHRFDLKMQMLILFWKTSTFLSRVRFNNSRQFLAMLVIFLTLLNSKYWNMRRRKKDHFLNRMITRKKLSKLSITALWIY